MIDLVGKVVIDKKGDYKKVVSQSGDILFLNDGNTYKYYEAFISSSLKMLDEKLQKMIERDVLSKVGVTKKVVSKRSRLPYEEDNNILYVPMIQSYANVNFSVSGGLESMHAYGNVAQDIYKECCSYFGWDYSYAGYFAKRQILYATNVTPENYSVWFLPHSNLNESESDRWQNLVSIDFNYIKEIWKDIDSTFDMFFDNDTARVTFIKQSDNKYLFLGIYVCDYIDYENYIKIYKRVDLTYPN